jgi:hypothetical protein
MKVSSYTSQGWIDGQEFDQGLLLRFRFVARDIIDRQTQILEAPVF